MNAKNKTNNILSSARCDSSGDDLKQSNVDAISNKNNPHSNNRLEESNFQPNSCKTNQNRSKIEQSPQDDHLNDEKKLMDYSAQGVASLDKDLKGADDDYDEDGGGFAGSDNDEDDERFVKKDDIDSQIGSASDQIAQDIMADLDEYHKDLDGIKPNNNSVRCLSSEHGGLEVEKHDGKSEEDVWDNRSQEVEQMADDEDSRLSDTNTSSLRMSFIHRKKQEKKRRKRHEDISEEMEEAQSGGLNLLEARNDRKSSHTDRLNTQRSSNSKGGGGIGF